MSGNEPVDKVSYLYDGGLSGLYCCVYESIRSRSFPLEIITENASQLSLLPQIYIEADFDKAYKIRSITEARSSFRTVELIENVFLSCMKNKEMAILHFLIRAMKEGKSILNKLGDKEVASLFRAEGHLMREAHLLTGFIRFSDYDGVLVSRITSKNFILPFVGDYFINRFPRENFLIHDKTHNAAFIYQDREKKIISIDHIELNEISETEVNYRSLWKQFYHTIAIESRRNSKLRMNNMPKRYWDNMIEMRESRLELY